MLSLLGIHFGKTETAEVGPKANGRFVEDQAYYRFQPNILRTNRKSQLNEQLSSSFRRKAFFRKVKKSGLWCNKFSSPRAKTWNLPSNCPTDFEKGRTRAIVSVDQGKERRNGLPKKWMMCLIH